MNRSFFVFVPALLIATLLSGCGSSGGGDSAPTVTVRSAAAATPVFGQPLLFTFTGENLDQGLTGSSPGCNNITLSTTAPNISTAATAYFTCVPSVVGAQIFTVSRSSDGVQLFSVAYTVPRALPTVRSGTAATPSLGEPLLFTFTGENLNQSLTGSSAGCTNITLSSTAPNISTATTAYFTCVPSVVGAQTFVVSRGSDGGQLFTVNYTVPTPPPVQATVTSAVAGTPSYGQTLTVTVNGVGLDKGIGGTSSGCKNVVLSTTAPTISTATTAYLQCAVSGVGAQALIIRNADGAAIGSAPFTVPLPQVTLAMSNSAGVNGNLVITLEPGKAPITVDNFLAYVKSGFYVGTIIHRNSPGFVLQGGGFAGPLAISNTAPTLKTTRAPIVLEDDKGLLNLKNTLSMARTNAPDSGTSQFFINLVDNAFLDRTATRRGYAVFGTITTGADLVPTMAAAPCVPWTAVAGEGECFPVPNITITSATQTR
jgi:cyclophilin family peptidyl-prolyl cis-trans isomerase